MCRDSSVTVLPDDFLKCIFCCCTFCCCQIQAAHHNLAAAQQALQQQAVERESLLSSKNALHAQVFCSLAFFFAYPPHTDTHVRARAHTHTHTCNRHTPRTCESYPNRGYQETRKDMDGVTASCNTVLHWIQFLSFTV